VSSNLDQGEVNNIMWWSDLWQVGGFFPGTPVSSTNKTDRHDITEILLKVALNTITIISNLNQCKVYERSNLCVIYGYHLSKQKLCIV